MDHPLDENVLETEKYAFLLGCSLRENNLEQFFSVYDAILPKHLSENQLDKIKERARQISELPEDKFNVLVLKAREFSLAQGRPKMSSLDATRGPGSDDWNSGSEDEEDATDGRRTSYHDSNFILAGGRKRLDSCERDSGLPSSGKGAGSCYDIDMSDSEERGVYDYFPTEESIRRSDAIKISNTVNPDFDEVHDVESDKSSIESPRSEASSANEYNVNSPLEEEGTELKTFSRQEFPSFRGPNIHKSLYHRNEYPYSVLRNENDDEDEEFISSKSQFRLGNQRKNEPEEDHELVYGNTQQQRRFVAREFVSVDDSVCFSSLNRRFSSHFSHTPEEAESGGFQKHDTFYGRKPPFGLENQLKSVGHSLQPLLSSSASVANMPPGAEIDDPRKKKNMKKKKGSKDDGDERVTKGRKSFMNQQHHDENGNPIDIHTAYRQMRELPNKAAEGSVVSSRKHSNYGTHTQHGEFSRETSNFDAFPFQGQSVKDVEDGASNTDRKKPRKKTKEPVKLAQDIPNYVGNTESVDDLVKFIETGEKQPKKKVNPKTSPGSEFAPKADKVTKKNKDKKGKVGQVDETTDTRNESGEVLTSPTPSTSEAPASPPPSADIPPSVADASHSEEEDMGNSGDKSAATSVVDSQTPPEEKQPHNKTETKVVLNKDIDPPLEKISSSKSPPLHKKEIEHKDRNKTKAKEKDKSLGAASPVESKKQKSKNGKSDLQLKNNKKLENKNDIINNTKPVDKMKMENGPIKVTAKLESDDLDITDNHKDYIFTDIDNIPPVEQAFILVSKKKKRQGAKEMVSEIPRQKNGQREYRGLPPPRSVTPPPSSLLKKEQTRDLSPSSFPALGKKANVSKGRPTFREGRRNSFGDVPIDTLTELRSQDDSDIESVKSLPAAKGGSLGDVVSSRFPVSYAKMAAAPKPPNSPTSPKADEEEELCDSQSGSASSRKPTVWKGSPTERRHSIGSSPEDTKQSENSPKFTQRSRQKSGSQEFLLNVESAKSDVDLSVPDNVDKQSSSVSVNDVNLVSVDSSCENTVTEELVADVNSSTQEVTIEAKSSPSSDSQSIPTITVTLDSNKVSNVVLKPDNQNGPKIAPNNGPRNGPQRTIKTEVLNYTATSRSHNAVSSGSSSKDPRGKPVSVSARVTNNSRRNNKSVIFLDKRFGDAPENLGITFGFDSNLETDDKGACDNEPVVDKSVSDIPQEATTSCDRKEPIIHNQSEPQSVPVTLPSDSSPKPEPSAVPPSQPTAQAPAKTASAPGGGSVGLPGNVPPSSTSSSSSSPAPSASKMSKTRVGGLNGVVMPKTQGYKNRHGSDALRTERVATTSEPKEPKGAAASAAAAPAPNKDNNKTVLFFYGEGIVAKLGNSDVSIDSRDTDPPSSSQHKGQLAFSPDANHKGKFNVNEAVKYLKQEWDKVLEQKDKNPQAVQYYNGQ